MVSFTCEQCQDTINKPRIAQHIQRCRGAWYFSCLDCFGNFDGDTVKNHTSCVTEDQRYQGKLYKPKTGPVRAAASSSGTPQPILQPPPQPPLAETSEPKKSIRKRPQPEERSEGGSSSDAKKQRSKEKGKEKGPPAKKQRPLIKASKLSKLVESTLEDNGSSLKRKKLLKKLVSQVRSSLDLQLDQFLSSATQFTVSEDGKLVSLK